MTTPYASDLRNVKLLDPNKAVQKCEKRIAEMEEQLGFARLVQEALTTQIGKQIGKRMQDAVQKALGDGVRVSIGAHYSFYNLGVSVGSFPNTRDIINITLAYISEGKELTAERLAHGLEPYLLNEGRIKEAKANLPKVYDGVVKFNQHLSETHILLDGFKGSELFYTIFGQE